MLHSSRHGGVELVAVVTRSRERRGELACEYPGVPAYDSLNDLLAAFPVLTSEGIHTWKFSLPGRALMKAR